MFYGDFLTFMQDVGFERIFAFQVYRRMFTPKEQEDKYIDETEFTDTRFEYCKIREVIPVGGENGGTPRDYLLGIQTIFPEDGLEAADDEDDEDCFYTYYLLSEIRLYYSPKFKKTFSDENEYDEEDADNDSDFETFDTEAD